MEMVMCGHSTSVDEPMTISQQLLIPEAPEEMPANSSAEGCPPWVIEPISNLAVGFRAFWDSKESIEQSVSGQDYCLEKNNASNFQDGATGIDDCPRTDLHDRATCFNVETEDESEVATSGSGHLNCEFGGAILPELEDVSGLERGVNKIHLIEVECNSDSNKCHLDSEASLNNIPSCGVDTLRNSSGDGQMTSEVLVVSHASCGSAPDNGSNCAGSSVNTLVERDVKSVVQKNNSHSIHDKLYSQVLHPQLGRVCLNSAFTDGSCSYSEQQCKKRDPECYYCPFIEKDLEYFEQKCNVSSSIQFGSCQPILSLGEIAIQEESLTVAHEHVVGKSIKQSIPLQPSPAARTVDDKHLVVPNASLLKGVADKTAPISDVFCLVHDEKVDPAKIGDACEAKPLGIQSSSLRRSSRAKKYAQKTEKTRSSRKGIKKVINMPRVGGNIDLLLKAGRRKRSCLSKPVRSSGWGLLTNLTKYFEQTNAVTEKDTLNQRLRKVKGSQRSRKQNKFGTSTSSRGLKRAKCVPSGPIRLKVIFGKDAELNTPKVMPLLGAEAPAIDCSYSGDNQPLGNFGGSMDEIVGDKMPRIAPFCFSNKNLEKQNTTFNIISFNADKVAGNCSGNSLEIEVDKSGCSNGRCLDPGTSPDSEVINQVPDSQNGARAFESFCDPAINSSKAITCPGKVSDSASSGKSKKKGKKKDKLPQTRNVHMEDGLLDPAKMGKAKISKKSRLQQKMENGLCSSDPCFSDASGIASINASGNEHISTELLLVADKESHETLKLNNDIESNVDCRMDAGLESAESWNSKKLLLPTEAQAHKNFRGLKAKGKSRRKSKITDAARSKIENSHRSKGDRRRLVNNSPVNDNGISEMVCKIGSHLKTGEHGMDYKAKTNSMCGVALIDASCQDIVPNGGGGDGALTLRPRSAWVCCDDCDKWRCIPAALADIIEETNCRWTCKDNQDKAFADCSIPQEMSNAEINAELEISDEEDAGDASGLKTYARGHASVPQQSLWMLIKSNLFLHRSRKTQTMDEIMVCHCKPPRDGRLGCGDECLNRMLNIECVQGTCPCGDLCSNQQFQRQNYAKLKWFRCGKKGYGLQVLEDISQGRFLIEYVGEVLDLQTYEARQREYASKGHKHFYFMTLNGNEVIDACNKGNLGRFINHSCDPNCRTEKWMVNGEICIGLFAVRNIKKGEELTFDYNYVRIFGAAAKKCYCGATQCRGYIGGDPLNTEVIVQGDSDDEYPEPVVVNENGEIHNGLESTVSISSSFILEKVGAADTLPDNTLGILSEDRGILSEEEKSTTEIGLSTTNGSSETIEALETEDMLDKPASHGQQEIPTERELMCTSSLSTQRLECSSHYRIPGKIISESVEAGRRSESEMAEGKQVHSKSRLRMKVSHSSKSIKSYKSNSNSANAEKAPMMVNINKSHMVSHKPKKLLECSANGHLEAVEEKLNDLLDSDGGICKRKDASRGYLKLLLLTAASGDNGHGGAIQSNRDLSMILDAILKTKSRGVLVDIVNKNGLQMLHNTMKQYRRDFKKIPILRKLLKVLEFLAEKDILTGERINADPPCPGVESFRESILTFTEHEDKKVHQIARNFRDKWIPRIRKFNCVEKGDRRMEFSWGSSSNRFMGSYHHWRDQGARPSEAIDCTKLSSPSNNPLDARTVEGTSPQVSGCVTTTTGTRKRKSRWDQPAEPVSSRPSKERKSLPNLEENVDSSQHCDIGETAVTQVNGARQEKRCAGSIFYHSEQIECSMEDDEWKDLEEDAPPPGFSSPPGSSSPPPGFSFPPPGFSSPLCGSQLQYTVLSAATHSALQNTDHQQCPSEVSVGHPQTRYSSGKPISYGIPISAIGQFGSSQEDNSLIVVPGIPFHPFPPLPLYPPGLDGRHSQDTWAANDSMITKSNGQVKDYSLFPAARHMDQGMPGTSCESFPDVGAVRSNYQHLQQRDRGSSYRPGRQFFRQQKWNSSKLTPPWLLRRSGWGFKWNNYTRNGAFCVGTVPDVQSDQPSEDVNHSVECAANL
ncbi:hypothetical protein Ancab_037363 [Ancistrocladus abbreviatus]